MREKGLGWAKAHLPWSSNGVPYRYRSDVLFKNCLDNVLPLADTLQVPIEPPIEWPEPPQLPTLGTIGDIMC